MTQDQNNQTILSEKQGIEQLYEQELQTINGGCRDCVNISNLASGEKKVLTSFLGKNINTTNEVKKDIGERIEQYATVADNARSSGKKFPMNGSRVCEDNAMHAGALTAILQRNFWQR